MLGRFFQDSDRKHLRTKRQILPMQLPFHDLHTEKQNLINLHSNLFKGMLLFESELFKTSVSF